MNHDDRASVRIAAVLLDRLASELETAARSARRLDDMAGGGLARPLASELQQFDTLTQTLEQLATFTRAMAFSTADQHRLSATTIGQAASLVTLSALANRLTGCERGDHPVAAGDWEIW